MKFVIDGNEFDISDDVIISALGLVSSFIKDNPFNIKELETVDLAAQKSLIPFIRGIHTFILSKYKSLPIVGRALIQAKIRGDLSKLESSKGLAARPPKHADPVEHGANLVLSEFIPQLEHIEKEIIPHAIIEIATSNGSVTAFNIRKDTDQGGGTVAAHGDIGIGKDDSREADRSTAPTVVSGNAPLHP